MSLDWIPFARFDQSRPSLSPEVPTEEQQRGALPASTRSRWKQNALQPPQVLLRVAGRDGCGDHGRDSRSGAKHNTYKNAVLRERDTETEISQNLQVCS